MFFIALAASYDFGLSASWLPITSLGPMETVSAFDHLPLIAEPKPTNAKRLGATLEPTSELKGSKMTKLKLTSALFSLAVMASPSLAQDFVDAKVQELFSQGYTHFEVSRGLLRTEIDAYGPNFTKLEVQLSNADGSVVSQRTEVETPAEYEQNISEITQTNSNIREELDAETNEADDLDEANDVEGADDDGADDDHASGSGSDDNDDGNDSDDRGDSDNDSNDNDGHDSDGHDGDDD